MYSIYNIYVINIPGIISEMYPIESNSDI